MFGNGGAALGAVSGCSTFDAYAIGSGGSHGGAAPAGLTNDHVFGFAKVTINGQQVTVTPTDELARTFDIQTYTFPADEPDATPPSTPTNLVAKAGASPGHGGADLDRQHRNATVLKALPDDATIYQDESATPGTTATYQVSAFDAAGNESSTASVTVTTPASSGGAGGTLAFAATDDATLDSTTPTTALGTANRITVDNSPSNDFLVTFNVVGTGTSSCPTITAARLRLTVGSTANDNSNMGGIFRAAVDSNWSEATVTWNTAPAAAAGAPLASITTAVALNTTYFVDVTPLVTGNGTITIRASGNSTDGARYFARNGNPANVAPELDVTCS